ncbi:MAG TPA: hypothetical protein VN695_08030 [Streptosporangiaceae bacterium]|nr:hypothetical protein [Streptosporangiaceae bacterium]
MGHHEASGTSRVDERLWHYADVECARCGVHVQVTKFSPQHTSVQWTAGAVLGCAEFAAKVAAGGDSALIPTCVSLRDSIDDAVAGGRIEVLPP